MSAIVDFPVRPEARPYIDAFAHRASGEPEWLGARRRRNLTRFAERGFPNRRSEAWRYIDLRSLEEKPMLPTRTTGTLVGAAVRDRLAAVACSAAAYRLVLLDGRYAPELSAVDAQPPTPKARTPTRTPPAMIWRRIEASALSGGDVS